MNLISSYQTLHEQVSLRIETGNTYELMEKVKKYQLDAAFVTGDLTATNFAIDFVQTDEIVLLSKTELDEASLSKQKWALSPKGCPFRRKIEQWFQDDEINLSYYIEISSLETILSSVKEGITATVLPKSVLTGSYEHLHVTSIPRPYQFIETGLIRRKEKYVSQAYKAFAGLVKEQGL